MSRHLGRNLGSPGHVVLASTLRASAEHHACRRRLRRIADFWLMQCVQGAVIALAGLAILGIGMGVTLLLTR